MTETKGGRSHQCPFAILLVQHKRAALKSWGRNPQRKFDDMFGDKFDEMDGGKMRGHEIGKLAT